MLDQDAVVDSFVKVAQDTVGSLLSTVGPPDALEPAVIKARKNGVTPSHPFIQVDISSPNETHGWITSTGLDENNDPYIDTHVKYLISYTVYGGNATDIARNLKGYFRLGRILDQISTETTGEVEQTFQVFPVPTTMSTEEMDVATFDLVFNINDRLVDPQTGTFNTIHLDGELKQNADDPNPLPIVVDAASP